MKEGSVLSVWKFNTADGAKENLDKLTKLANQHLIQVHDTAVVSWPNGKKRPLTKEYGDTKGKSMLSGVFWGMLFGMIFFVPVLGIAVGAAMGALANKFSDYGISENFIKQVRDKVTEGTSALFLFTSDGVRDRIIEEFKGNSMDLISTNLSKEEEDKLREEFGS